MDPVNLPSDLDGNMQPVVHRFFGGTRRRGIADDPHIDRQIIQTVGKRRGRRVTATQYERIDRLQDDGLAAGNVL